MLNLKEKSNCCGCYACYNICPKQCIIMKVDEEGFWYPVVNQDKCINCNLCKKVCPIINKPECISYDRKAYAMYNKNEVVRLQSSSGGIFTLLAEHVISNNGKVYGAVFDDNFNVKHIGIDKLEDISLLRGSKYVQSKIEEVYKAVKTNLNNNIQVLFTGTPCQVAGLKSFLQKEYDNLILMDIVCHGVPSPLIWQKYLDELRESYKQDILQIYFRNKDTGWKNYSIKIVFDKDIYKKIGLNDVYMRGFIGDIYLRPSCYSCKFKGVERIGDITVAKKEHGEKLAPPGVERIGDITVADFWGIQNIKSEIDDDKGVSLVVIQSKKGKTVFEKVKENIEFVDVDINESLKYNPSALKPVIYNVKRDEFFAELFTSSDIEDLIKKYTKRSIMQKIKMKIKHVIKR